jgi:hypothetical protein
LALTRQFASDVDEMEIAGDGIEDGVGVGSMGWNEVKWSWIYAIVAVTFCDGLLRTLNGDRFPLLSPVLDFTPHVALQNSYCQFPFEILKETWTL